MRKIAVIILLDVVAQAQVAMPAAAPQGPAMMQQEATMRGHAEVLQRREFMARLVATAGATIVEGGVEEGMSQLTNKAVRWAARKGGLPAMRAAKTAQKGFDATRVLGSSPVDRYLSSNRPSVGANEMLQPNLWQSSPGLPSPGAFNVGYGMEGLDLLAKGTSRLILFFSFLFLLAFCFCVAYFVLVCIRQGFWAAVAMIDSFLQEQDVLARIGALDLFLPPTSTKIGSLQAALLSPEAAFAKVGALSATPDQRKARTVPASMFLSTEGTTEFGKHDVV